MTAPRPVAATTTVAQASKPPRRLSGPAVDPSALTKAFEALKTYDYGSSRSALVPIDDAVRASLGNATAAKELARRLMALLKTGVSLSAKEYVCSKFGLIGSAESVPALAECLAEASLTHAARSALEAMGSPKADKALRDSLPRLSSVQKAGVVNSLGTRRDARCVRALAKLLEESDRQVAGAAAAALGNIGTPKAARILQSFQPKAPETIRLVVADACLACAERLLMDGKRTEALAIYQALTDSQQPKQVRQAARRGLSGA